jgi:hypothetical protein
MLVPPLEQFSSRVELFYNETHFRAWGDIDALCLPVQVILGLDPGRNRHGNTLELDSSG